MGRVGWVGRRAGREVANSVVTVFPMIRPPARRVSAMLAASVRGRCPSWIGDPYSVGMSKVSYTSFTPTGKPCNGAADRALVEFPRLGEQCVAVEMGPCAHDRLALVDTREERSNHGYRGDLAALESCREIGGAEFVEALLHRVIPACPGPARRWSAGTSGRPINCRIIGIES